MTRKCYKIAISDRSVVMICLLSEWGNAIRTRFMRQASVAAPLFSRSTLVSGLIQGVGILAVVAGLYGFALTQGMGEGEARVFALVSMVVGNRSRIRSILRSWRIS